MCLQEKYNLQGIQSTSSYPYGKITGAMRGDVLQGLRLLKRNLLYRGYSKPVYQFLKHSKEDLQLNPPQTGEFLVNLSFDLELSLNTYFWSGDLDQAIQYGERARQNMVPIFSFLRETSTPCNVQIVGMLLENNLANEESVGAAQRSAVLKHPRLFQLDEMDQELLDTPLTELGLHGYSHRLFRDLTETEAEYELSRACTLFNNRNFRHTRKPSFMSFPRNAVAHTSTLQRFGISHWRSNTQAVRFPQEIPLGLWFSPGSFDKNRLRKFLREIRANNSSFLLHLWGHLTEMDLSSFKNLLDVMKNEQWLFQNIREITKGHE